MGPVTGRLRVPLRLLPVLLLALPLAACGGEDDGPAPGATTSSATSEPTVAETTATEASSAPTSPDSPSPDSPRSETPSPAGPSTSTLPTAPPETGIPADYESAAQAIDAAGDPVLRTRFSTASDIYCVLSHEVIPASCELPGRGIVDPDVCTGGATDAVGRIEQDGAGFLPVCNTDTVREPGAKRVPDGTVVSGGELDCLVADYGVVCVLTHGTSGFSLGPGGYQVF